MSLIGLCGYKTSGKSTVGKLFSLYGYTVIPFAEPMDRVIWALTGRSRFPDKEAPVKELCLRSQRYTKKTLGTEWARDLMHPSFWLIKWKEAVEELGADANIVVDDVRFPNEGEFLRSLGATLVQVVRPGIERADAHISESLDWLQPDWVIHNDGSLMDLHRSVKEFLE